jgi:hypothetical protein
MLSPLTRAPPPRFASTGLEDFCPRDHSNDGERAPYSNSRHYLAPELNKLPSLKSAFRSPTAI